MSRVALTIGAVLISDIFLLLLGWGGTVEINVLKLSQAYGAYSDHPSIQTQHALDIARHATEVAQYKIRAVFSLMILLVTAIGFFFAGRSSERHRKSGDRPIPPSNAKVDT